jgi:hypothetical protein
MRTRRTKEQIRKDNYNKDVDAYNFYVVNLDTMRAETGFEFREDAVDLLNDYDDKKKYKVVSKRALKSMGIENPNESFKYEGGGNFQSGVYATGGEVRRFNRHEQMDSATREEIMDVIQDLEIRNPLTNYLYGLFDGYDYSKTKNFKIQMNKLRAKDFSLHKRIKEIYSKIDKYKFEKYNDFADGGYFDGTIPNVSTYMNNFAKGGGLYSHGIKQGDTFLKTLSGGIQKVKDKNGNIFYINLATGERSATIPLPFENGGGVKFNTEVILSENRPNGAVWQGVVKPFMLESIEKNQYAGGFKRYEIDIYDEVDREPTKEEVKKANEFFDKIGGRYDDGGEVKYFLNKDGIKVRSVAKPEKKLSEREWMAKHNESKEARSYAFGGLFGKSPMMSKPKHIDLDDKQVRLKTGEYVQVLDQTGDTLMVMELSKIGTGASPKMVKISDVDMTSYANGGEVLYVDNFELDKDKIKNAKYLIQYNRGQYTIIDNKTKKAISVFPTQISAVNHIKTKLNNYANGGGVKSYKVLNELYKLKSDGVKKVQLNGFNESINYVIDLGLDDSAIKKIDLGEYQTTYANGGGVGLIGNQKRIDMNHNGRIDAEDFEIMRSTMDGAWRNEHKHVNSTSRKDGKVIDYEVRYARKNNPSRKGYNGKTFATGGGVSKFKMLSNKVARNYEGKRVKPQYQKEYGKVYSKEEAKEVGNKVAGKIKANQKMATGGATKKGGQGGIMVLAKQIRKEGESWKDALKRAGQQLK